MLPVGLARITRCRKASGKEEVPGILKILKELVNFKPLKKKVDKELLFL